MTRLAYWRDLVLGRVLPGVVFGLALVIQADRVWGSWEPVRSWAPDADLYGAVNSTLILVYYAILVALYVVRLPPKGSDRRSGIVIAAFAGTLAPMCIPLLPRGPRQDWLLLPADVLSLLGVAWTLWALLSLGRSFAILPQARRLVTGGPYGLCRNPLYLGEVVGGWAVFLPTLSWPAAAVLLANVGLLLIRVKAEERVLLQTFGAEYAEYLRRVPRFLPLGPRRPGRLARRTPTT